MSTLTFWWLLLATGTLSYIYPCGRCTGVHYLIPDYESEQCLGQPCFTLNDYITQDDIEPFASNTTVIFQSGYHLLNASEHVVIRDVSNLHVMGQEAPVVAGNSTESGSEIVCIGHSGFYFVNVSQLTIANVIVTLCGVAFPETLLKESLSVQTRTFFAFSPPEQVAIVVFNAFDMQISGVVVQKSYGYGLLAFNMLGNSTIEDCTFLFNNAYILGVDVCQNDSQSLYEQFLCAGGNMAVAFVDTPECVSPVLPTYSLRIVNTYAGYGANALGLLGSGLTVVLAQTSFGIHIDIDNLTAFKNSANVGANIAISVYEVVDYSTIVIRNSHSTHANPFVEPTILGTYANAANFEGGGLFYGYGSPIPTSFTTTCPVRTKHESEILTISKTEFASNTAAYGGGVCVFFATREPNDIVFQIHIEHCTIVENIGSPSSGMILLEEGNLYNVVAVQFILENTTFVGNVCPTLLVPTSLTFTNEVFSTLQLLSVQEITIANCRFEGNLGTGLDAYNSRVHFYGDVTFARNYALSGGGLGLSGGSLLLLTPGTHISLVNNHAKFKGGAIYVTGDRDLRTLCFFQIEQNDLSQVLAIPINIININNGKDKVNIPAELDIVVKLENNTANTAGSALYGGAIDRCVLASTIFLRGYRDSGLLFDQLFHFSGSSTEEVSLISSDPHRVCMCEDDTPHCDEHTHNISVCPGQTFEIKAVAYGQRKGVSPTVVYSSFIRQDTTQGLPLLGSVQTTQEVGRTCTPLRYTVLSREPSLLMFLSVEKSSEQDETQFLTVNLQPCPPGFALADDPPLCICDSEVMSYGLTCDIDSQTIHRTSPYWISTDHRGDVVVHRYCPFDFCTDADIDIHVNYPDSQCANHRTGTLCGACQPGLSAVLGSSNCEKCSNDYIALVLPFLLMGIALVLLLYVCCYLHTTVGAINGLIFYANILQFNKGVFFPPGETNVLTVFIAWLNLDLGIPTCLYDGLDTYEITWLQFLFPAYIWTISFVIIVVSHYSYSVSKLIGERAVPVLSTLFLLSFAKLLRTIIIVMSFTFIDHKDGSRTVVWLYDGNLTYFASKRIPLLLVALAVLLFLTLPYILLILLGPWLQAASSRKGLRWVNHLKHFLDAY